MSIAQRNPTDEPYRQEGKIRCRIACRPKRDPEIRAGYSKKTANEQGARLLASVKVAAGIAEAQVERSERTKIDQDWVLLKLAEIVNANMADYVDVDDEVQAHVNLSEVSRGRFAAITEIASDRLHVRGKEGDKHRATIRTKIKLSDRQAAPDKIARHVRFYNDRLEHTGKNGGPIETKNLSELELARRIAFHLQAPEHVER